MFTSTYTNDTWETWLWFLCHGDWLGVKLTKSKPANCFHLTAYVSCFSTDTIQMHTSEVMTTWCYINMTIIINIVIIIYYQFIAINNLHIEVIAVKLEKGITPGSSLFFNPWTIPKVSKLLLLLLLLHDKKVKLTGLLKPWRPITMQWSQNPQPSAIQKATLKGHAARTSCGVLIYFLEKWGVINLVCYIVKRPWTAL